MKESVLVREVVQQLNQTGGFWFKIASNYFTAIDGISDVIGCYKGRFVSIEFKVIHTPMKGYTVVHLEKSMRPGQHKFMQEVCQKGSTINAYTMFYFERYKRILTFSEYYGAREFPSATVDDFMNKNFMCDVVLYKKGAQWLMQPFLDILQKNGFTKKEILGVKGSYINEET